MTTDQELKELQAAVLRTVSALLPGDTAQRIGNRLALLSQGSFIPADGYASIKVIAGMLGISERSVEGRLEGMERHGNGSPSLHPFSDLTKPRKDYPKRRQSKHRVSEQSGTKSE